MTDLLYAFEIAKNFPSGVGGFFGSVIGGIITAFYLRKMLINYLERTVKLEKVVEEHGEDIKLIKAHIGLK